MESLLAVIMGLGLAASCGLRVFLPMLVVGVGSKVGVIHPHESMAWLSSWPAILALGAAAAFEATAALVPWVDHALDAVAGPAGILAGAVIAASALADLHPGLGWTASAIVGAGGLTGGAAAGAVKAASIAVRGTSTAATAGLLNPLISAAESAAAALLAFLAAAVPILLAACALLGLVWLVTRRHSAGRGDTRRAAIDPG